MTAARREAPRPATAPARRAGLPRSLRGPIARPLLAVLLVLTAATALAAQVPAPADVFGFRPGTDYELADHSQMLAYFDALDRASDRVLVERIGTTTLGRPMILALVSSAANLRDRERHREIARRLALAEGLSADEARRLARGGRAVVWIDGGLHSTEVAHAQHTPELAHWLATDEGEEARRIREKVILLLMPVMNPDGLDIVVDWYRRNLGTEYETAGLPWLYHHYIGHDNNRDWYMFTQVETQAVADVLYHRWFPQIVYNHHQSSPFPGRIWTPPFANPVNPNLDPLVVSSLNQIGEAMKKRFDEEGKPGAVSGIVFDLWWNGSMRGGPDFHNMLGFLTETALYRYATPYCYADDEVPETFGERGLNLPAKVPSTGYTNPWTGGCWHLRDAVDYMLTASRAVLDLASRLREDYLFNIYRMGARQTARGRRAEGGPFAYVIDPSSQHDPGSAVALLRVFRRAGIEIRRADRPLTAGGRTFNAGSYAIGPQAFRPFVVDLMEPKTFPDRRQYPGGPPIPPYDMTGYELSFQMGVDVVRVTEPFPLPEAVVDTVPVHAGRVEGRGGWGWLLSHAPNASARAVNRLLAAGASVAWTEAPLEAAGSRWPAGTLVVRDVGSGTVAALAAELGLTFRAVDRAPDAAIRTLRAPRIGLYKSWTANMDEGWIRWLLERHEFTFDTLSDARIRAGRLSDYDVIVLPSQGARSIERGHDAGDMPPEYVGGIGEEGAAALKRYVEAGGWLVAIDQAADFAIANFALPVRNAVADLRSEDFFIPGSLIRIRTDPADPLAYGMPEDAIAMFARSQVFELAEAADDGGLAEAADDRSAGAPVRVGPHEAEPAAAGPGTARPAGREAERAVAYVRYADRDYLASGWAHGADRHLAGMAAAVRVPVGRGQVVLLGFRPHSRGQPHNTFKLLFNPLHAAALERGR